MKKKDQNLLLLAGAGVGGYLLLRGPKSAADTRPWLEQAEYALRNALFTGDLVEAGKKTLVAIDAMTAVWKKTRANLDMSGWFALLNKIVAGRDPQDELAIVRVFLQEQIIVTESTRTRAQLRTLRDAILRALDRLKANLAFVNEHDLGPSLWSKIFGYVKSAWKALWAVAKFIVKAPGRIFDIVKWGLLGVGGYIAYTMITTGKLPKAPKLLK